MYDNDYRDDDEDDEDEDENDGELLGLSEEEVERMVFASAASDGGSGAGAGAVAGSAAAGGAAGGGSGAGEREQRSAKQQQQQKQQQAKPLVSPADAIAAAGLPSELEALVAAAHQAGAVGQDGDALSQQLTALLAEASASAADVGAFPADGAGGAAGAAVLAVARAVSDYLAAEPRVAVGILLNHPRYMHLTAEEADKRLRVLAFQLGWDLAEAQEAARRNPALLLVPSEPLARKLTALANATGLSKPQAASMVTTYMFPGL
ncbi:hypothetical protein GPECTOR_60g757 [Gonium pectorale]|uniref:Uncharacterized protein n=1 Tax=Gonium pectorale TaxID=33097 RepID=A0A150G529_GONPE|nr:hypothetical protein GPECTOR_60g757 [Gonium pectorale]|eukprot:KXZ44979.1 hypothetical protein GPECTOR_60g757 [Gonium pectorale]